MSQAVTRTLVYGRQRPVVEPVEILGLLYDPWDRTRYSFVLCESVATNFLRNKKSRKILESPGIPSSGHHTKRTYPGYTSPALEQ